jgi:hypothetical protein
VIPFGGGTIVEVSIAVPLGGVNVSLTIGVPYTTMTPIFGETFVAPLTGESSPSGTGSTTGQNVGVAVGGGVTRVPAVVKPLTDGVQMRHGAPRVLSKRIS